MVEWKHDTEDECGDKCTQRSQWNESGRDDRRRWKYIDIQIAGIIEDYGEIVEHQNSSM